MKAPLSAQRISRAWEAVAINALFFLSGLAALVYEISWTRQLGILFGHTSQAAAVVLGAYFGGMGVGYALGSRWAARMPPLRGYAVAEFALGIWALLIPFLLRLLSTCSLLEIIERQPVPLAAAGRVIVSLLVLSPATVAMGTTLPFLAVHFERTSRRSVAATSTAYAWNTLGAFVGLFCAIGFLLITLGVEGSSAAAAMLSLLCAIGAVVLSRFSRATDLAAAQPWSPDANSNIEIRPSDDLDRKIAWIAAISGFVTLALEVLYTRLFSLVFHNSTHTFAIVIGVFLFGLSLGAFIASRLMSRVAPERIVRWGLLSGAACTSLSVLGFVWWTRLDYVALGPTFPAYLVRSLAHVAAVLLMPVTMLGTVLPAVWQAAGSTRLPQKIALLTMLNTLAAATGALSTSFVLLPWLGLWRSFAFIACVAAAGALLFAGRSRYNVAAVAMAAFASSVLWLPELNPTVNQLEARGFVERWSAAERGEELLRRWETPYGWIDVTRSRSTDALRIRQNLHYSYGSTGDDVSRERRQAHLPLLLHPNPQEVLFLGLGTGLTASGALPHPEVKTATVVELIPEVVTATRMLADWSHQPLADARLVIEVDDARHSLRRSEKQFDVIVSDLFVSWESTTGYLYTTEHYRAARERLNPNGLFCQWLALYQVGEPELQLIADSLSSVFPHVTLWWGRLSSERPIIALIGSEKPIQLDQGQIARRLEPLRASGRFHDNELTSPVSLFELWIGDWPRPAAHARLNSEEFPRVEFSCPASHGNRRMLSGKRLLEALDRRLLFLPRGSVAINAQSTLPPRDVRWQRSVLFPEIP